MDVRLSPEQEALRDAAAQAVDRLGPHAVAELDDPERTATLRATIDRAGWRALSDGGQQGAPAASGVEVAVVAEEFGRALADVAYMGPVLAADLRRRAGAPAGGSAETVLLDPTLVAPAVAGDGRRPAGVAIDAGEAVAALLLVRDGSGASRLATVPVHRAVIQLDLTRRCAAPDAAATVTELRGDAVGDDDLAAWTALGLAVACADLVGVMRGALELARSYAAQRRQFDAPVGSFQAVQHLLADAHVATEGSRSVALHAAWAVDALSPEDALAAAALAKAYCARAARVVCESAVQVHGGIGNTWDCLAHVFLRRALLSGEVFGGADTNVERVLAHHGLGARVGSGRGLR
jgi:alkylation response protein AidB-like acyl-CoA dehydrogenase